jgi:hypothetical protein
MFVFTFDLILSLLVTALVLGIIAGLAFFMICIMGWAIGALEVLSLIIFMGYAVTYSLHIAHNFAKVGKHPPQELFDLERKWLRKLAREERIKERRKSQSQAQSAPSSDADDTSYSQLQEDDSAEKRNVASITSRSLASLKTLSSAGYDPDDVRRGLSPESFRRARVRIAVLQVGGATFSSAISTIGCSFFLLFCTLRIFVKLGAVVMAVTVLSIMFALIALPATLMVCHCEIKCGKKSNEEESDPGCESVQVEPSAKSDSSLLPADLHTDERSRADESMEVEPAPEPSEVDDFYSGPDPPQTELPLPRQEN